MEVAKIVMLSFSSAVVLFFIAKVIGHKQMAQLDLFDYITGITIGSIAAEMATELENPIRPFIAMCVYGAVTAILSMLTGRFIKLRKFVNGTPTIIMWDGKLYRKNMKKAKLELTEFMVMCRQEGYFDIGDIDTAVFEYNGRLTVLPKTANRTVTVKDMKLTADKEEIKAEIIMDGRILHENLKRLGLDVNWLKNELKARGYTSQKQVFLGLCNRKKQLTLFPNSK